MTRRRSVLALAAAACVAPPAVAQTRGAARRIGALWPGTLALHADGPWRRGFLERLRALGWVEGGTIEIQERFAEGRIDRFPDLARELVALRVELIVAAAQAATEAAIAATRTIPIVMIHASPLQGGLIQSLARPGGNVTGSTSMSPELAVKQVELLRQLLPAARRIAMLANPLNVGVRETIANAVATARQLDIEITAFEATTVDQVEPALVRIAASNSEGLLVAADPITFQARAPILEFTVRTRMPAVYGLTWMARDGGLISYAANFDVLYPRAAEFVDRILRGAKPADLPVEQPAVFELVVNLRTARAAGIEIPRIILDRADEVIE